MVALRALGFDGNVKSCGFSIGIRIIAVTHNAQLQQLLPQSHTTSRFGELAIYGDSYL